MVLSKLATRDTGPPTPYQFWAPVLKLDMEIQVSVGQRVQETLLRTAYADISGVLSWTLVGGHTWCLAFNFLVFDHDGIAFYLLHARSP
jgi:hypothetical protein